MWKALGRGRKKGWQSRGAGVCPGAGACTKRPADVDSEAADRAQSISYMPGSITLLEEQVPSCIGRRHCHPRNQHHHHHHQTISMRPVALFPCGEQHCTRHRPPRSFTHLPILLEHLQEGHSQVCIPLQTQSRGNKCRRHFSVPACSIHSLYCYYG